MTCMLSFIGGTVALGMMYLLSLTPDDIWNSAPHLIFARRILPILVGIAFVRIARQFMEESDAEEIGFASAIGLVLLRMLVGLILAVGTFAIVSDLGGAETLDQQEVALAVSAPRAVALLVWFMGDRITYMIGRRALGACY